MPETREASDSANQVADEVRESVGTTLNAADLSSREREPLVLSMPIDVRNVTLSIVGVIAVIFVLRYMQEVLVPFVLGGLVFYALDPVVDRLEKWKCPRALAAALALLAVVGGVGGTIYSLREEAMAIVEDLPRAARKLRETVRMSRSQGPGAIDKVQRAATEIERTATEAVGKKEAPPRGVVRVQVEEPTFRAGDYVWWGSLGAFGLIGQGTMILFLTYFLLVSDDLFKRKLVKFAGPTLSKKKITVQILDQIAKQIEQFLFVQVFTSLIVAVATWAALWWVGLNQAAVWGLAAGVFNSIPYFGPMIVTGGLLIIAFMQFGTLSMAALVAGIALVITALEGWLLTPMLLGKAARMNHVAVFAGLLFWSWMWGILGLLLAVPMVMVVKAVCDHIEDLQPIGEFLGE